jgi:glycosyltransferase involved in cell wall biosynthesis
MKRQLEKTDKAIRVCLMLEGSYPFITGGVSAWVHQLITSLQDIEFALWTISPEADQPVRYALPDNVKEHRDVVISQRARSRGRPKNRQDLLRQVENAHELFLSDTPPELDAIVNAMPSGFYLYADAVGSETGWEMITRRNREKNPVFPFSDYFWAWKGSHDMMFTVLGADLPEADVYHAVSTGYAGLAAVSAKIRKGKPFVLTEHGLYHKEREMEIRKTRFIRGYQRDMWIGIYNNLSRLAYRYADLIIALFEYNRLLQVELGAPEEKTRVIPNGIDTDYYSGVERSRREGFHVGLVGRVVPIKDIKTFISACRITADLIPDSHFYCIGPTDEDPGYFEDCRMLVENLKLKDCFHFTGRADVREYYGFLDVLLLTSVREAQPLVILEAYCAGVPVVATRVGNVPELLDYDDRFIAPSKDPEALAASIKYIHDNPGEMAALKERNKDKVLRFYNRRELLETYRDIYSELHAKAAAAGES